MNSIISFVTEKMLGLEKFMENSEFQYKYLIKLAIDQKVSWATIKTLEHPKPSFLVLLELISGQMK